MGRGGKRIGALASEDEDLYEYVLGPVLQKKVHFAWQVTLLRDGFNLMCNFAFTNNKAD